MKKILVVLLSLTLIFAFTGCTSSNNGAAEDIEIKTQEVVTSNTDDNDDNISNTENAVENANEKDYDFSSYENDIRNITKSVNNAKTSTNASENHEQFYALKKQVDAVDDELDKLDDEFEYAYQMKEISFETYKARERTIEKLDFGLLSELVIEELQTKAQEKNIEITLQKQDDLFMNGDQTLILRMMMNLITNAINYGKTNGHIHIILKVENDQIVGEVKDDGIGISEEHLNKIWERFYRNLALFTSLTTDDLRLGIFRVTTLCNISILIIGIVFAFLSAVDVITFSENGEKLFAMVLLSCIMVFIGIVSPKLPYNRHTGLRLPWTVRDEDTWKIAHRILGFISFPMVLLYIACALTISDFEIVSVVTMLIWISIPGGISYIYFYKKYHSNKK
jgi:hypothetical protein